MRLLQSLALGLIAVSAAIPSAGQPVARDAVVATVGDEFEITVADLDERAERIFYRGVTDRPERYQTALHEATLDHLKSLDFFRLGFDQDTAFISSLGRRLTEELLVAYFERQYEDPYLNEEAIRAEHEAMSRVVTYRQIVLRKPPAPTEAALRELRSRVDEIRRQIDDGASVDTLVARYSEDEASARSGGRMAPVTWRESQRSPYSDFVFRLEPGEAVSFETQNAFIIAVADRVESVPVPPLGEARDRIVEVLRGRNAARVNQAYYAERQGLVDSVSVRWNEEALAQVVQWSRTPGFYEEDYADTVDQYLAGNGDTVIFTDSAGELRISELPHLIREVLTISRSGNHSDEFVQDYLLEAVRADRMALLTERLGLRDELLQPNTPSPILAEAFARYYDKQRIDVQLPDTTEAALQAFYEAYDDSLFYQLPTVYTKVIERDSEGEIDEVWSLVQAGVPFEEASNRVLLRSFERSRDGDLVSRFNREPPYLAEVAFGLGEGEVAGPVAYDTPEGRRYAVILVTRRLDERQLTYEEVRDRVVEAFLEHHRDRLEAEVEAELLARYPVTVHDAVLDEVLTASR